MCYYVQIIKQNTPTQSPGTHTQKQTYITQGAIYGQYGEDVHTQHTL
jgi:hypothetical protein